MNELELANQKSIFENVLVNELMFEVKFLWDQAGGRSDDRPTSKQKVTASVLGAISKLLGSTALFAGPAGPIIAIAGVIIESSASGIDMLFKAVKEERIINVGNLFYAEDEHKIKAFFQQSAKAASLRYEYLIGCLLSTRPDESVIPLARVAARRIMEYLCRLIKHIAANVDDDEKLSGFPLTINFVLNGIIQGHSGKWADSWRNSHLSGIDPNHKNLTVEGALSRSAMRVIPNGKFASNISNWPIHYTEIAVHKKQSNDAWWDWGRTKFLDDKLNNGPKYGPLFVTDQVRAVYEYNQKFPSTVNGAQKFHYYPTVKIVSKDDVLEYDDVVTQAIRDKKSYATFVSFVQQKYQAGKAQIYQVWVRNADFSDSILQAGIYNDVDFSGCCFNNTIMTDLICNRSNFSFIQAKGIVCQNVNFDQANFNFAILSNAEFDDKVSYIGVTWVGTILTGLSKNKINVVDDIQKVQKDQTELADTINENILKYQDIFRDFETEINTKQEAIESQVTKQISDVDDTLKDHAIKLVTLTEEITQTRLNCQNWKTYLETKTFELNLSLTILSAEQTEFRQRQKARIESIDKQLQNLQQSNDRFGNLIDALQSDLSKVETKNAERLASLTTNFTSQNEKLKNELLALIYPLRDKIDLVDVDLQLVKRQMTATTRKITVNAFINNKIYGNSEVGSISAAKFIYNTNKESLNKDELELIEKILKNAEKADEKLNAFKNNLIAKGADSKLRSISMAHIIANTGVSSSSNETFTTSSNHGSLSTTLENLSISPILDDEKKNLNHILSQKELPDDNYINRDSIANNQFLEKAKDVIINAHSEKIITENDYKLLLDKLIKLENKTLDISQRNTVLQIASNNEGVFHSGNITIAGTILNINSNNKIIREGITRSNFLQYEPDHHFKRAHLLELETEIKKDNTANPLICAITGIAGCGKTELSKVYMGKYLQENPESFGWYLDPDSVPDPINSNTRVSYENAYESLLRNFHISIKKYKNEVREETHRRLLSKLSEKIAQYKTYIMIFDNAEYYSDIQSYIPSHYKVKGLILFTSRKDDCLQYISGINFSVNKGLQHNEAMELLTELCRIKDDEANAKNLLMELDYSPLAIRVAAGYILRKKMTFRQYSMELSIKPQFMDNLGHEGLKIFLSQITKDESRKSTLPRAIELLLKEIQVTKPSFFNVLQYCAYIANENIPEKLLIKLYIDETESHEPILQTFISQESAQNKDIQSILEAIIKNSDSLLTGGPNYYLHRITQFVIQSFTKDKIAIIEKLVVTFLQLYPYNPYLIESINDCQFLAPHLLVLEERSKNFSYSERAKLLVILAQISAGRNQNEKALTYLNNELLLIDKIPNENVDLKYKILQCKGYIYDYSAMFENARVHYHSILIMNELSNIRKAEINNRMSYNMLNDAKIFDKNEAFIFCSTALTICESCDSTLLETKIEKGRSYGALGQYYAYKNEFDKAMNNYDRSIEIFENFEGGPDRHIVAILIQRAIMGIHTNETSNDPIGEELVKLSHHYLRSIDSIGHHQLVGYENYYNLRALTNKYKSQLCHSNDAELLNLIDKSKEQLDFITRNENIPYTMHRLDGHLSHTINQLQQKVAYLIKDIPIDKQSIYSIDTHNIPKEHFLGRGYMTYPKAVEDIRKALDISIKTFGDKSYKTGLCCYWLSRLLYINENNEPGYHQESLEKMKQFNEIISDIYGPDELKK